MNKNSPKHCVTEQWEPVPVAALGAAVIEPAYLSGSETEDDDSGLEVCKNIYRIAPQKNTRTSI